jgi:endonuclease G
MGLPSRLAVSKAQRVSSRKLAIVAFIAGTLLIAALITAVILALRSQTATRPSQPTAGSGATVAQHIYGGLPDARSYGHPIIVLTNQGYLSGYCEARRNPAWVSYSIGSITVGPAGKRLSRFITDTRTRSAVTHQDYSNSGFDRGHMAPNYAIATRYGAEAQRETFLMSNIVPQSPNLNRIWWRLLEEKEADDFAVRLERVWVTTGPVFGEHPKKLPAGVEIPSACFRILLDEESGQPRVLAFIAPQTVTGHEPLTQFLTSVREIEHQTHLDFFPELPKEVQERMETTRAERLW